MTVTPRFEPVQTAFAAYAEADPSFSAQLAVHHRGQLVVDLTAGIMQPDSLLPVFSSSKGATAIVIALLVERGQLDLDAHVASYWPQFAAHGKRSVTVRQLLSHQAGLPGVDGGFTYHDLSEHTALAARLAAQRPFWQPGHAFMYHALTIGTLADELVRRIDGRSIAQVLRDDIAGPRGIDVWMSTPPSEDDRVLDVLPPEHQHTQAITGTSEATDPDPMVTLSMPPGGGDTLVAAVNSLTFRRAGVPAAGMVASARGMSTLYATARHDVEGPRLLNDDTIGAMSQVQIAGLELGTGWLARYAVMFQAPCAPRAFGSARAFGHSGAGGSLAFCDPTYDIAFGFTQQHLPLPNATDTRAVELARVLRQSLAA